MYSVRYISPEDDISILVATEVTESTYVDMFFVAGKPHVLHDMPISAASPETDGYLRASN